MADIKLFDINGKVTKLQSGNVTLEKNCKRLLKITWKLSLALLSLLQNTKPPRAVVWIVLASTKITVR